MLPHISRRCLFISNRADLHVPKLMAGEERRFWDMTTTSNKHHLHILLLDSSLVVYPPALCGHLGLLCTRAVGLTGRD
jgi:hypothetical protein